MRRANPGGGQAPAHPVVARRRAEVPEALDGDGRRMFESLVGDLEPAGLFEAPDAEMLALYVQAVQLGLRAGQGLLELDGFVVEDRKNLRLAKHPLQQVFRDNVSVALSIGKQFGITPVPRLRVNSALDPEPDDGDNLFDT